MQFSNRGQCRARIPLTGFGLILVACIGSAFSQSNTAAPPSTAQEQPQVRSGARRHARPVSCWKQAGIAPNLVNEHWKIEDQSKAKIAAVCTDPALSPQQRHDKISQIDSETDKEIAQLIPAKQLEMYKSCRAELDKDRPKPSRELGPCGGVIPATASTAEGHQHGH